MTEKDFDDHNNLCQECFGTGKRKITFEDCYGNPVPEKTVYLKCNCKEVASD